VRNRNEDDSDLAFRFYAILQPLAFESRNNACARRKHNAASRNVKAESNPLQGK
jgi:hypothetical protein